MGHDQITVETGFKYPLEPNNYKKNKERTSSVGGRGATSSAHLHHHPVVITTKSPLLTSEPASQLLGVTGTRFGAGTPMGSYTKASEAQLLTDTQRNSTLQLQNYTSQLIPSASSHINVDIVHGQDILDYDHRPSKHVSTVDTQTYRQSRNQAILSENQMIKGYASRREIESAMQKLHGPTGSQLTPAKAYEEYRDNGRRIIHKHASAVMEDEQQKGSKSLGQRKQSAPQTT